MKEKVVNNAILKDKIIIITGGAGGIGLEIALNCQRFGSIVIILENSKNKIAELNKNIERIENIEIIECDISNENDIGKIKKYILSKYKQVDIIINNATTVKIGKLEEIEPEEWDISYKVNIRGPVLLIRAFLQNMKKINSGTIVFMPSSGAAPYMGCYEILKTAQIELCNTLLMELENTRINTFCVGPGYVKTETTKSATKNLIRYMKINQKEFDAINRNHELSKEEAGLGIALSLVNPEKYNGKEIGSIQVLIDNDIIQEDKKGNKKLSKEVSEKIKNINKTYEEQYNGWLKRNIFEKQWVLRDFKKTTGYSVEEVEQKLKIIIAEQKIDKEGINILKKLGKYYIRQRELNESYIKNIEKKKENEKLIAKWAEEVDKTIEMIGI